MPLFSKPKLDTLACHLGCDIHNHLLPGVDDGLSNNDEASTCIKHLKSLRYRGAIVTPHIYKAMFGDTSEHTLRNIFATFQQDMASVHKDFKLALGAEYMMDDDLIDKVMHRPGELLTFGDRKKYLLVEFATSTEPLFADELIEQCQQLKITPIFAHVERYMVIQADRAGHRLMQWQRQGAMIQVNIGSLVGQFGTTLQNVARRIAKANLIDVLGSDLHSPRRGLDPMTKGLRWSKAKTQFAGQKQRAICDAVFGS